MPLSPQQKRQVAAAKTQAQKRSLINRFNQQNLSNNRQVTPTRRQFNPQRRNPPPNRQINFSKFTGNSIYQLFTAKADDFNVVEVPLSPDQIPTLERTASTFLWWRYNRLSIAFTPSLSNTTAGYIFYAIAPWDSPTPTQISDITHIQGVVVGAIHNNNRIINAPRQDPTDWFHVNTAKHQANYKFIYGSTHVKSTPVGSFSISYDIEFRQPL